MNLAKKYRLYPLAKKSLLLLIISISTLFVPNVNAQGNRKIGYNIDAEYNLPMSENFNRLYRSGIGFNSSVYYQLREIQLSFSVGIVNFFSEKYKDEYLTFTIPNILALTPSLGVNYFVLPNLFLYAKGGIVYYLDSSKYYAYKWEGGAGYVYKKFLIGPKLETWYREGSISFAGLKLGYSF